MYFGVFKLETRLKKKISIGIFPKVAPQSPLYFIGNYNGCIGICIFNDLLSVKSASKMEIPNIEGYLYISVLLESPYTNIK